MDEQLPYNEIEKQTTEKEIKHILKYQTIYEIYICKIALR